MQDVQLLGVGCPGLLLGRACGANTLMNLAINKKLRSKILSANDNVRTILTNEKPESWGLLNNEKPHLARLDCAEVDNAPGQELDGLGPGPVILARVQLQHSDSHHMSIQIGL